MPAAIKLIVGAPGTVTGAVGVTLTEAEGLVPLALVAVTEQR